MRKFMFLVLLALALAAVGQGCKSDGSREFIPGRGWKKI